MPEYQLQIENSIASIRDQDLPLGDIIINRQRQLPPFDFYSGKPERQPTSQYLKLFIPKIQAFNSKIRPLQTSVDDLILKAQELSWNGSAEKAIIIYEAIIKEKYPYFKPYNLLISIYQKNKNVALEIRAINQAIRFFTGLREDQKNYVLSLAANYQCEQKARQYIDARKKILYYADAFVLYDPAIILDQWQKRLDFVTKNVE